MRPAADRLAAIIPARPGFTADAHRQLVDDTIGAALCFTGMVRDEDPADAAEFAAGLPAEQAAILPFVLAAFVDIDRTPRELLAWTGWANPVRYDGATAVSPPSSLLHARPRPTRSTECGSEGGWREHQRNGGWCDRCSIAHDAHIRDDRARARKARRARRRAASPIRLAAVPLTLPFEDTANAA